MLKVLLYLKHFFLVTVILIVIGFLGLVSQKGSVDLAPSDLAFKVGNEGPHMFHHGDEIEVLYIRGTRKPGFDVESHRFPEDASINADVYFPLEDASFQITVKANYETPASIYNDGQPIIAISDLEGNYRAFRDFLLANRVIDSDLTWQYGKGHLVLLGDMVDRGHSTTQLLWFIYKLELEAKQAGGLVHYIIGNHEIKNMQGNFNSAADKYLAIAGIMGKQQHELFGKDAVLGRWLESKNVVEKINGHLFVHGGLDARVANIGMSLEQINALVRKQFRTFYVPRKGADQINDLLVSTKSGPAWYRGYFKDDISLQQIEESLNQFSASAVVVGHTLQFRVNSLFEGKVLAIDVKHPDDYNASFPVKRSEGLLIESGRRFRLLDDGEKEAI